MTRDSSIPQMDCFFARNFGQGRRVRSMKAQELGSIQTSMWMFARLIRMGWAVQSLVMVEMFLLSEEHCTIGSIDWLWG